MSDKGLPSLEEIWADADLGDGLGDGFDGGQVAEDELDFSSAHLDSEGEQSEDDKFVPAKLSDLFAQSDDDGQAETGPIDLAQEIPLDDGTTVTLRELIDGRLMRSDYTRKTQELASEREQFETQREQLEAVKQLKDMITSDPYTVVTDMAVRLGIIDESEARFAANRRFTGDPESILPTKQNKAPSPEDLEALVEQKAQEKLEQLLNNNPTVKQLQTQAAWAEVNNIFDQIEQVYDTQLDAADRQTLLKLSVDLNEDNLEYVFLRANTALQKRQSGQDRVRKGQGVRSVRGTQPNNADLVTTPPADMDEAFARTAKRLGISI